MLRLNALSALNNLLAFGVAAFLFRKNPLLPGLILYAAIAIPTIYILHSIAVPADPSITCWRGGAVRTPMRPSLTMRATRAVCSAN